MNISITNACNRRCAYCFQKDWYLSKKANQFTDDSVLEMPLEAFEKLCVWSGERKAFNLMGGEPLLYSRLPEMLDIAKSHKKEINFLSNISADEPLFDRIYGRLTDSETSVRSFLVNSDYPASQERILKRNFSLLCKTKLHLAIGTTLLPGGDERNKSRKRIAELAEIYREQRGTIEGLSVRLAPFCPNPSGSITFMVYNFTQDVVSFINSLFPTGIQQYGFDCPVNLCELDSDFVDACRECGIRLKTRQCGPETGMPFDILVDYSVIWCSSANFIKLNDWRDYSSFEEAKYELSRLYYDWWRTHSETSQCKACDKHNPGYCSGFCIAKTKNLLDTESRIPIYSAN